MKVGLLGSGDVGRRLGDGLIEIGHTVTIGTRNPKKNDDIQRIVNHDADEGKALAGSFAESALF